MKKRKRVFSSFFFFYYCCYPKRKKDHLVDTFCKHRKINKEVFAFNNSKRQVDSFVDHESNLNGVARLQWTRSWLQVTTLYGFSLTFSGFRFLDDVKAG